ncbi:MAG: glycosyltransferase family 2 protein [Bdellovibrionales bacterium]|nr:glycosyltransferase family 2 protein [Bdellovibrionales bacterium]
MSEPAAITLFILHWNRPRECLRTVECFLSQGIKFDLTVLDNGSNDKEFSELSAGLPNSAKVIRLGSNIGWGPAFNSVLKQFLCAPDDFCILAAHDALPQPKCIELMISAFRNDPSIGILCPEYGDSSVPHFNLLRGTHYLKVESKEPGTIEPVPFPHGTIMGIRKQCVKEIGLFDERFFAYGDEFDLGLRARDKGWKTAMIWGAFVVNPGSWTPDASKGYLFVRNALLLSKKRFGFLLSLFKLLLVIGNTIRLQIFPASRKGAFYCENFTYVRFIASRDFLLNRFGSVPDSISRLKTK